MILRATPYPAGQDEGHWKFLALVIQPDGIYLREWDKDAVTELGGVAVEIPKEQWHAVTIELSGANGETVTVKQALHNASETQSIEATTAILEGEYIGFGVGEKANFRFDDVGTDKPVAASVALRYHYDAYGRVVGRTLDPDGTNDSQFFIYDNDRIVQELDGTGALVAEWVYGTYIDEILAMFRDTDGQPGLETYYYLQDDLYNVVALTDANGAVVERYTYDDYGAPSFFDGAGNPISGSQYGNPFLFTGRRWDEVLSLYDYRTRYYNPYLGRFLRIDTIGPWGDASNLGNPYAYVGNNPWSRLDPYGEATQRQYQRVIATALDLWGNEGNRTSLGTAAEAILEGMLKKSGHIIIKGPVNSPGQHNADIVAFDPETGELYFIDNKVQQARATASWADSVASTSGREKSIAEALDKLAGMKGQLPTDQYGAIQRALKSAEKDPTKAAWLVMGESPHAITNLVNKVSHRMWIKGVRFATVEGGKVKINPAAKGKSVMGRVSKALPAVGLVAGVALYAPEARAAYLEDTLYQEQMVSMGVVDVPYAYDSTLRSGTVFGGETVGGEVGGYAGAGIGAVLGLETGPGAIVTGIIGGFGGGMIGDELGGRGGGAAYDWLFPPE